MLTLSGIHRYPIKSCRGQSLDSVVVRREGLDGDRRWMLVDADGDVVTARAHPRLLLVEVDLLAGGALAVTGPDAGRLAVDVPDPAPEPVRVHGKDVAATPASAEAGDWFSAVVGEPVRLVYLDDPTRRHPNPRFAEPTDVVNLADAYPVLVTTRASLDALNDLVAAGPNGDQAPLPMRRFRPGLVVEGGTAWDEDGWRRVRVGDAVFRAVKGCDRCVMTTHDPDTAARGHEPIATLARHRRWDGATWFGMNLIPDTPGVTISVGDEVEILESVPAPDGPPR